MKSVSVTFRAGLRVVVGLMAITQCATAGIASAQRKPESEKELLVGNIEMILANGASIPAADWDQFYREGTPESSPARSESLTDFLLCNLPGAFLRTDDGRRELRPIKMERTINPTTLFAAISEERGHLRIVSRFSEEYHQGNLCRGRRHGNGRRGVSGA